MKKINPLNGFKEIKGFGNITMQTRLASVAYRDLKEAKKFLKKLGYYLRQPSIKENFVEDFKLAQTNLITLLEKADEMALKNYNVIIGISFNAVEKAFGQRPTGVVVLYRNNVERERVWFN